MQSSKLTTACVCVCFHCSLVRCYMKMTGRRRERVGFTQQQLEELQESIDSMAEAFAKFQEAAPGVNNRTMKWHRLSELCCTLARLGCLQELSTAEYETAHTESKRAYRCATVPCVRL